MGNCNCKNTEIKQDMSMPSTNSLNQSKPKREKKEEKYFKLHRPKVTIDIDSKQDKTHKSSALNSNINISKGGSTINNNVTIHNKAIVPNDLESIDEKVVIQNTKGKNNYINQMHNSQLSNNHSQIQSNKPQHMIISQVASYNCEKSENNGDVNRFNQEEALDPLSKAFSMNHVNSSKYEETRIEQRELFSLIDSTSFQKNYKEIYEETSSRETYSYLHSEIRKSSFLLSLILKKKHSDLRYEFNVWKGKTDTKIKVKIIKTLALIKMKTIFGMYYRKNYYSLLIERLKLYKRANMRNKSDDGYHRSMNAKGKGLMNQMVSFMNMSNKVERIFRKYIFRLFVDKVKNSNIN